MGWVSNERAMLISRQIRAGMCRWEHCVETQSQVPSITQNQNKREWMHLNIFIYLDVLKLYNFNTYLTCSCSLCLSFFAVLHKKQAGNAGVTVAAMGMTWFFNQACLQYSLALIAALRSYLLSGLLSLSQQSNSGFCLCSVVLVVLKMPKIWATQRSHYCIIHFIFPLLSFFSS